MPDRVLSYSFVGVWSSPIQEPGIQLDRRFCLDLFQDPYSTQIGADLEGGVVISKVEQGMPPPPTAFTIGPMRFKVISRDLVHVRGIMDRVQGVLPREHLLSAVGLNTEHEWEVPAEHSTRWLADRYVPLGMTTPGEAVPLVELTNLQFGMRLDGPPARLYNIQLQPRGGNARAIFASVNDHREWGRAIPGPEEIERLLNESVQELDERIKPLLTGELPA